MELVVLALPVLALVWLVSSIVRLCRTSRDDGEKRRSLKRQIAAAAIIIAAWILVFVGLMILVVRAVVVNGM